MPLPDKYSVRECAVCSMMTFLHFGRTYTKMLVAEICRSCTKSHDAERFLVEYLALRYAPFKQGDVGDKCFGHYWMSTGSLELEECCLVPSYP